MAVLGRVNGVGVNIGYAGTPGGLTFTDAGIQPKLILQTADSSNDAENYEVYDEAGNLTISAWLNPQNKAMMEFVITGAGGADALNQTQIVQNIQPGDILIVTSCVQLPGLVKANWEVLSAPKVAGSNKDAKKFTVNVRASAGITGAMPA
jgi:hypothetical protein